MRYLLTGATGFLGRELLVRLLRAGEPVLVVTRAKDGEQEEDAKARVVRLISGAAPEIDVSCLTVAHGDVSLPDLGLTASARAWLRGGGPVQIIHGAAEVRFHLPYERMHRQNVAGTERVLELARGLADEGRLNRVDHVSTAFVAGDRTDLVLEDDRDEGQKARNDYERTKLEAELRVGEARAGGLPIAVHRPSIIVGDSRTGRASSFKVLYWPLMVYARRRFRTLFGRPDCTIDVVPVDYVADAMCHLFRTPEAVGRTFHLAAGSERQSTIGELAKMARAILEGPPIRYVDPDLYMRYLRPVVLPVLKLLRPDVAERGGVYLPYLRSNPSFSVEVATRLLSPANIAPPKVTDYFDRIVRYAVETDFGRAPGKPHDSSSSDK